LITYIMLTENLQGGQLFDSPVGQKKRWKNVYFIWSCKEKQIRKVSTIITSINYI